MPVYWNESLAIGVPTVDAQHRELFDRIARFEASLEQSSSSAIAETFEFLRSYAAVHFADEERLMRETAYPDSDAHVAQHRDFTDRLDALVHDHAKQGAGAFVGLRARNWILIWLVDHVGVRDQALGRHVRARASASGGGTGSRLVSSA